MVDIQAHKEVAVRQEGCWSSGLRRRRVLACLEDRYHPLTGADSFSLEPNQKKISVHGVVIIASQARTALSWRQHTVNPVLNDVLMISQKFFTSGYIDNTGRTNPRSEGSWSHTVTMEPT
jgi:hypothetical protein